MFVGSVICKKIKGKQEGVNNVPVIKALAEFTRGVSSGGSFQSSSSLTLHRLSSMGIKVSLCLTPPQVAAVSRAC